jgi:Ca2+-binding RTX toxin-like protein
MATIILTSGTIAENMEGPVRVGTLGIQDRPGEAFVFTLAEHPVFEIVATDENGTMTYDLFVRSGVSVDYEAGPRQFALSIAVTDGQGNPVETDPVVVDVTDVNEAPTDIVVTAEPIPDNADLGTPVATLEAEDPDEGQDFTYALVDETGTPLPEHDLFEINDDQILVKGQLTVATHNLWVKVTDSGNPALSYVKQITLTVVEANEPPEIAWDFLDVAEGAGGGTLVGTLTATDPEGGAVSYTLSEASDEIFDLVDNHDGTWSVVVDPGVRLSLMEAAHQSFTVQVSDGTNTVEDTFDINLVENQGPEVIFEPEALAKTLPAGAVIGILSAMDNEEDAVEYTLLGDGADLFEIAVEGGKVVIRSLVEISFANPAHHSFTVQVSDGVNTVEESFDLTFANEAPAVAFAARRINEGAKSGTVVGRLNATDPEGDEVGYALSSASAKYFRLVENDAGGYDVVVRSGVTLDYETLNHRSFRVTASDGENEVSRTLALNLVDRTDTVTGSQRRDTLKGTSGSDVIKGLGGDDTLIAYAGDDTLHGGSGKDVLSGGAGRDVFVFDGKPNKRTNVDRVTDFSVKDDAIRLDNKVFAKLGKAGSASKPAALKKDCFATDRAKDKNDYLIYDSKTGVLSYDADGSRFKSTAVEIAQLKKGLGLTYKDFFVI